MERNFVEVEANFSVQWSRTDGKKKTGLDWEEEGKKLMHFNTSTSELFNVLADD